MKYEEYEIKDNFFEYLDKQYDCSFAIKRDIKLIIQEAEISHRDTFDEIYNRDSLTPIKARIFFDNNENLIFGMIIYTIDYKDQDWTRTACGHYYPIWTTNNKSLLMPHPYQGSICW